MPDHRLEIESETLSEPAGRMQALADAAARLLEADKFAEAEAVYCEMIAHAPGDPAGYFGASRAARGRGDREASLARLRVVAQAGPGHIHAAVEIAADLRALGRLDEAEAVCRELVNAHPDSADAYLALGHCARARGDRAESLKHFEAAVAADPRHIWAINEAAADLREAGRLDEAEAGYRRLLEIAPGHAHGLIGLGYCARLRGDLAASLALFQGAAAADPGFTWARIEVAGDLRELGRLDEAEAVCRDILAAQPHYAEAHLALGHCARSRGNRAAALAQFQAAAAADPENIWARNEAATELRELGQLQAAAARYRELLEISPNLVYAHLGLGYCARARGDGPEALAHFQDAARADPGNAWAHVECASIFRELGDLDAAEAACSAALAAQPNHAGALVALGHCARARGDRAAAIAHFRAGAAADPGNIWAINEITHELRESGDADAARRAAEAALQRHPNSLHLMLSVGLSERAAGRHAEALAAFAAAHEAFPEEPGVLVEMAVEERALGRQRRCDELLARALALDPRSLPALLCQAEQALMAAAPEQALALLERAGREQPEQLALKLATADALAALGKIDDAITLLAGVEGQFGPLPAVLAKRVYLLRQSGDLHEALRLGREVTARLPHFFGGWTERFHAELLAGSEADIETCLAQMPAGSAQERASVTRFRGNYAESCWRVEEAIGLYETAAEMLHQDAGLQHELVRAKLLRLDVAGAMVHLRRAVALTAHQTRLLQKSLNISQTHFGQVIDDYRIEENLLNVLISLQKLEPAARVAVLGYIVRETADSTAAAVALMVAMRQAGAFARRVAGRGGIPRRIIQFWDAETPPEDVARLMRSWRAHNPGLAHHLFNEGSAREFLAARFPASVLQAFSRVREPAQKADIFRLAVLAVAGGVYADADDRCLQAIDSIVPETAELVVYQEDHGTLGNNFMAARPRQDVVVRALEMAVAAVNRGDSDIVWLATGPGLLTRVFGQFFARGGEAAPAPGVVVLDRRELFAAVAIHCAAGYKRTDRHWSNTAFARRRGVLAGKNDNT
jgi:tetratricopeptide (TPR) repeat protein